MNKLGSNYNFEDLRLLILEFWEKLGQISILKSWGKALSGSLPPHYLIISPSLLLSLSLVSLPRSLSFFSHQKMAMAIWCRRRFIFPHTLVDCTQRWSKLQEIAGQAKWWYGSGARVQNSNFLPLPPTILSTKRSSSTFSLRWCHWFLTKVSGSLACFPMQSNFCNHTLAKRSLILR